MYLGIELFLSNHRPVHWLFFKGNEFWKDVPGYEGNYQVSTFGRIKSVKRNGCLGGIIVPQIVRNYWNIKLCKNNKCVRHSIHKIVASTFLQKPDFYECINHKDCNKLNNKPKNLEYTTLKLNSQHAWLNGRCEHIREIASKTHKGRTGILSIFSKSIIQIDIKSQSYLAEFISATEASKITGVCRQHISQVCTGYRKSAGGYHWKHKN